MAENHGVRMGCHCVDCQRGDLTHITALDDLRKAVRKLRALELAEAIRRKTATLEKNYSAPASPQGDVLTRNSGDRASSRDVATATAAQGPGSGDGGERPALPFDEEPVRAFASPASQRGDAPLSQRTTVPYIYIEELPETKKELKDDR